LCPSTYLFELLDDKNNKRIEAIRNLSYYGVPNGDQIIWDFLPLIPRNRQNQVYEAFERYQSPENRDQLLAILDKTDLLPQQIAGICKALKPYRDRKVHDRLVALYHRTTWGKNGWGESAKGALVDTLRHHNTDQAKAIAWEVLLQPEAYPGNYAAMLLVEQKVDQKKIVDELIPIFYDPEKKAHLRSVFATFSRIQNPYFLPPAKDLFEVFVRSQIPNGELNIVYTVPSIFEKKYDNRLPQWMHEGLYHENAYVRRAMLESSSVLVKKKCPFQLLPESEARIYELLEDKNSDVVRQAQRWVGRFSQKKDTATGIEKLLQTIESRPKDVLVQLDAMRSINSVLGKRGYHKMVAPIYLEALKHPNRNIRVEAINGLLHSDDKAIKARLEEMKSDPDPEVQRTLNRQVDTQMQAYMDIIAEFGKKQKAKVKASQHWTNRLKQWWEAKKPK
jgi:hypothetical protein